MTAWRRNTICLAIGALIGLGACTDRRDAADEADAVAEPTPPGAPVGATGMDATATQASGDSITEGAHP